MPRRLLATVLVTDIVGSTERAASLRDPSWNLLRGRHDAAVRKELRRFGGREINTSGDGFLAAFDDPANAIRCAAAVRETVRELDLEVRNGLHMGQVEGSGRQIGGLAVHISARVSALAQAGEILVSSTVRDALAGSRFEFSDRAVHSLKGVPGEWRLFAVTAVADESPDRSWRRPWLDWSVRRRVGIVSILAAIGIAAAGSWILRTPSSPHPSRASATDPSTSPLVSVAVLPFDDLSRDRDNEYFSDGMTEELINALAHVQGLQVASRTSAFAFKGKGADIQEIGRTLNVSAVVEGSVRKVGSRLRITAQLVNVEDGYHLWSEAYDRELEDVFAVQEEISRAIVDALRVELGLRGEAKIAIPSKGDANAYDFYLRGNFFLNKATRVDLQKALDEYARALAIDPRYVPAHVGEAAAWQWLADAFLPPHAAYPKARAALEKALAIDSLSASALASLGTNEALYEYDLKAAERHILRAIEIDSTAALFDLASLQMLQGRYEEALSNWRKLENVDPLSPNISDRLAETFLSAGRLREALAQARHTREIAPSYFYGDFNLGLVYRRMRLYDRAIAEYLRVKQLSHGRPYAGLAITYVLAGRLSDARNELRALEDYAKLNYVPADEIAGVYGHLGDHERAFQLMEQAYTDHSAGLAWMKIDPDLDPLRSDPRFLQLLKRVGLA